MYGLLGKKLSHSFSKEYFTDKFSRLNLNDSYVNIELEDVSEIVSFVKKNKDLKGFNVTVPYKESIIAYLDDIDEIAKEVGAVNTVKVYDNGKLKGFNTDVIGFEKLLETTCKDASMKHVIKHIDTSHEHNNNALIFGSGGASKAVQYVLRKNNIPFKVVSRNQLGIRNEELGIGIISYDDVDLTGFSPYTLLINTTPVGMFPNVNECLELPYSTIVPHNIFIDLIYNPDETLFLKKARLKGASTYNGLKMLYEQAEAAWKIWENWELGTGNGNGEH